MIPAPSRTRAAFTLVEMVVALTILSLISGTVLAIVMQAGDTAADIRYADRKDEEISRFIELLERTVETLPVDASIEMIPESESVSGYAEMKIENAVGAFLFGEDVGSAGELTIALLSAENFGGEASTYVLALSRDSFSPDDADGDGMVFGVGDDEFMWADTEGRYWLPLVDDIRAAGWRYWNEESQEWLTEWAEENLPPLMELVIEDSHRPGALRTVFEIPEHLVTGEGIAPEADEGAAAGSGSGGGASSAGSGENVTSRGSSAEREAIRERIRERIRASRSGEGGSRGPGRGSRGGSDGPDGGARSGDGGAAESSNP